MRSLENIICTFCVHIYLMVIYLFAITSRFLCVCVVFFNMKFPFILIARHARAFWVYDCYDYRYIAFQLMVMVDLSYTHRHTCIVD